MAVASTPFLYCSSSLFGDLMLSERTFFEKHRWCYSWNYLSFFFRGEDKKHFLLSVCGTKKDFWITC